MNYSRMKSTELRGLALRWAVARTNGCIPTVHRNHLGRWVLPNTLEYQTWEYAGPLFDEARICFDQYPDDTVLAYVRMSSGTRTFPAFGKGRIEAGLRCWLRTKTEYVDVPDVLLEVAQ